MNFNFLDKNLNLGGFVNKYIKGSGIKDADFLSRTLFEGGRELKKFNIDHVVDAGGFGQGTQELLNQAWTDEMTEGKNFNGEITSTKTFFAELDEPTYLTFKVAFGGPYTPIEPLHIASYAYKDMETYAGNMLKTGNMDYFPHPLLVSPAYDIEGFKGRRRHVEGTYSTYSYLMDTNNARRAVMLYEFQKGLHELQSKYQYYFQSISGLGKLLETSTDGQRVKDNTIIKIKCLNSIDQKVKYLLQLYKQICYDETYQRWILPDMMRYFKLYIFISEVKRFHGTDRIVNADNPIHYELGGNYSDIGGALEEGVLRAMNSIAPVTCIECSMCEFDIKQSLFDDSYSINPEEHDGLEIPIKVGKVTVHERYPIFADVIIPTTKDFIDEYIINVRDRNLDNSTTTDMTNAARDLGLISTEYFNNTPEEHKEGKSHKNIGGRATKWLYNLMRWGIARGNKKLTDFANKWLLKPIKNGVNILDLENAFNSKDGVILFGTIKRLIKGTTESYQIPNDIKDTIFKDTIKYLAANKGDGASNELAEMAETILKDQKLFDDINNITDEELLNKIIESNKIGINNQEGFNLNKIDKNLDKDDFNLPNIDKNIDNEDFKLSEIDINNEKHPINLPKPIIDIIKNKIGFGKPDINIDKNDIDFDIPEIDDSIDKFDMPSIDGDEVEGFDMPSIGSDKRDKFELTGIDGDEVEGFDMPSIDGDEVEGFELSGIKSDKRDKFNLSKPNYDIDKSDFKLNDIDKNLDKNKFNLLSIDKHDNTTDLFIMPSNDNSINKYKFEMDSINQNIDTKKLDITNNKIDLNTDKQYIDIQQSNNIHDLEKEEIILIKNDIKTPRDKFDMYNIDVNTDVDKFKLSNIDKDLNVNKFKLNKNISSDDIDKNTFDLMGIENNKILNDEKIDLPDNKHDIHIDKFNLNKVDTNVNKEEFILTNNKSSDIHSKFDLPKIKQDVELDELKNEFMTIFNTFNSGPNAKVKPFKLSGIKQNNNKEDFTLHSNKKETDRDEFKLPDNKQSKTDNNMKLYNNKHETQHVNWEMDKLNNITVVDDVDISGNKYDK